MEDGSHGLDGHVRDNRIPGLGHVSILRPSDSQSYRRPLTSPARTIATTVCIAMRAIQPRHYLLLHSCCQLSEYQSSYDAA